MTAVCATMAGYTLATTLILGAVALCSASEDERRGALLLTFLYFAFGSALTAALHLMLGG